MQPLRRRGVILAASLLASTSLVAGASSVGAETPDPVADRVGDLRLDAPLRGSLVVDGGLVGASGDVEVSIRLDEPAVAAGGDAATIAAEQAAVIGAVRAAGGRVDGTVDTVLNAVFATVDGDAVDAIVATGVVLSVHRVAHYELDLSETVPYIGADTVRATGNVGAGVTVAVLDSGVDYTHADLGGPGTIEAYEAAHGMDCSLNEGGTLDCYQANYADLDGLFPTPKVIGGFDFVGEAWPNGERTEDPDPIDYEGHGTHVADIIGGAEGLAPGASILGIKVCSAVSSSCNGVALLKGVEYAVENGADIINMSLGGDYGSAFDDDVSLAVDNATRAGVLTVASAGNGANKPYVTGTPASAPTALSVAQTAVPSAVLPFLTILDGATEVAKYEAIFQDWSLVPDGIVGGTLQYADGAGGNLEGCDPFAPGSLDGLVVVVDRGSCSFTQKIANIANAGGAVGIIGLVTPGDPFNGGFDGAACDPDDDGELDCDDIPGYMVSQADSAQLKGAVGLTLQIDPADGLPLVGTVVGSSSRGPGLSFDNLVKPEIAAPGASVSAEAGTGTGTTPFGGTSGAAPMVAGSAALVLADDPGLAPLDAKALLVNTGETGILTGPGAALAPISRIGGGEVRVDRAIATSALARDAETGAPALSFGFVDVDGHHWQRKMVEVTNTGSETVTYDLATSFRYADDEATGAVRVSPSRQRLRVRPGQTKSFRVVVEVDGSKLRPWTGGSGGSGADPAWLDLLEYDGYLTLDADGDADDIHLPWHILPRQASDPVVKQRRNKVIVKNEGVAAADVEVYNLIALSEDLPEGPRGGNAPTPDFRAAGVAFYDVSVEVCANEVLVAFAVNTWEPQTHSNAPALFEFDIDVDGDGEADYAVFNADLSLLLQGALTLEDGRNAVYAQDLETGEASVLFFTDHDTNSANTVLLVCGEQIGLDAGTLEQENVGVGFAVDIYYGGPGDSIEFTFGKGKTESPLLLDGEPVQFLDVAPGEKVKLGLTRDEHRSRAAMLLVRGGASVEAEFVW